MNLPLFKATTKANWVIGLIIYAVLFMYLTIIITMFDPETMEGLIAMVEALPKEVVAAMNFNLIGTSLTHFLASYFYGFLIFMFPMIYCIIVANRLVAKHVDSGSMAFLLSTPHSRITIITTQALYLISSVTLLFTLVTIAGILVSQAMFPGQLDTGGFLLLNIVALLITYSVSGICFLCSSIFDDAKFSAAFGAGIPLAFFVLNMLANVGDKYAWLRNVTIFSLLNPAELLGGTYTVAVFVIPGIITLAAYISAVIVFNRRSLPL
jgi:ABC-2 type transport system permease protein